MGLPQKQKRAATSTPLVSRFASISCLNANFEAVDNARPNFLICRSENSPVIGSAGLLAGLHAGQARRSSPLRSRKFATLRRMENLPCAFRAAAKQKFHCCQVYGRRSLIDNKISAIASERGLAPRLPLPWTRTLTASASMSRFPITNIVWTFICSAR